MIDMFLDRHKADWDAVKNCKTIYQPQGRAGEYARLATNPYRGCGHACAYCYVPNVIRIDRKEFDAGASPRKDYLRKLRADAKRYFEAGITDEPVLLSFSTDPFNPHDTSLTRPALATLRELGIPFTTLTKGGARALPYVDLFGARDSFATTLTTLDDDFSRRWERGAALPQDRLDTLRAFHDAGIRTWVSLEPVLDADASRAIIEAAHGYVDHWKLGRTNYIRIDIDWAQYRDDTVSLLDSLGADYYVKQDLADA